MPMIATTGGAPSPLVRDFPFQSWFDSALMQQAIAQQNSAIVLPRKVQIGGQAVQAFPGNQTPIAIDFTLGNGVPSSQILMKPGQIIRPGRFTSFEWGLPFGWLGGGVATILVANNPESDFDAPANAEVVFHRVRLPIIAPNAVNVVPVPNWPIRFPWPNAVNLLGANQGQSPVAGVVAPTKIMARLRAAVVPPGGAVTRFILFNVDEFDRDQNYAVQSVLSGAFTIDVAWQPWVQSGITVAGSGAAVLEYQGIELDLTTPIARLGGDNCALVIVDVTPGGPVLVGTFIDFTRWGVL